MSASGVLGGGERGRDIEFSFNDNHGCMLINEGLLTISPMKGVVEAGGFVMIHVTLIAQTVPIVFGDKVSMLRVSA